MQTLLGRKLEIHLFDSFEVAARYSEKQNDCALLVANAYRDSDYFYMNPKTSLLGSFFFRTPDYFICCKDKMALKKKLNLKKRISIVTHKAPSSRIKDLIISAIENGFNFDLDNIEIEYTEATSKGAEEVSRNAFDCCLTNKVAANKYLLDIVSLPLVIEMTWAVFIKTNKTIKEHKQCLLSDAQS
jgi:bacilysin biosynthesis protein BacA